MSNYECVHCNAIVPVCRDCPCGEQGRQLAKLLNTAPTTGNMFDVMKKVSPELEIANLKDEVRKLTEELNHWKQKSLVQEQSKQEREE